MHALGVPLAGSLMELGDIPARLVDEELLYATAKADAEEWRAMEAERKAKHG